MKSWISTAVLYQINLRSLAVREPRNAIEAAREKANPESPLAYVTKNLPVIRKLGANVLYFLPPYPIGNAFRKGIGSPYSIRDFKAIEPEYGTIEEMAELVRRAHKLKFKVIFDITPNHSSRDNVWMTAKPDYYVKRENGDVFYDCDWSDTAKLDYRNPGLRAEMIEVYHHWLGFLGNGEGIDGFRLDMAHFINDKGFWNEAMAELKRRHAGRELLFLAECYGFENNLDLFDRGINAAYDDDFYKVCQHFYGVTEDGASAIVPARDLENNGSFKRQYDAFRGGGVAGAFGQVIQQYLDARASRTAPFFVARYTDNHDEGRGMFFYGEGAVRAINALLFLAPGTLPFILTGEEFGAMNRPPIHERITSLGRMRRVVRGDGTCCEQNAVEFEANVFLRSPQARADLYRYFQDLIRLRTKTRELTEGTLEWVDGVEDAPQHEKTVIAFERRWKKSRVLCAVNLGPKPRRLGNAALFSGEKLLGQLDGDTLPAFSAVVARG
jgi:glycosidase